MNNPGIGSYLWTSTTSNFTATGTTISRPNASIAMSGLYKVQQLINGCASTPFYFNAKVFGIAAISSIDTFCTSHSVEDAGKLVIGSSINGTDPMEYSLNDGAFQSSPIFEHLNNGLYRVTARAIGSNCNSVVQTQDLYCAMMNLRDDIIQIFPNPNAGSFTLNSILKKPSENITIVVYDLNAKVIYQKHIDIKTEILREEINIKGYAGGTYMVKVSIDADAYLLPVVIY